MRTFVTKAPIQSSATTARSDLRREKRASSRASWRAATEGPGGSLPERHAMEAMFGQDFSGVRAYFGRAAQLDALGALAATDGRRVAFASSMPDRRQIAHELAHVLQMRRGGGVADGDRLSEPDGAAEREADLVAARAETGAKLSVGVAAPPALHRDLKSGKLEVPNGHFRIDMAKQEGVGGETGEKGHIHFEPKATAPDSNRIRLSQAVSTQDLATGAPLAWAGTTEANREKMTVASRRRVHKTVPGDTLDSVSLAHFGAADQAKQIGKDNAKLISGVAPEALADTSKALPADLSLQILGAVKGGFFIDHLAAHPAAKKRASSGDPVVLQDYVWPGEHAAQNHDGQKKGGDIKEAVLGDFPHVTSHHLMFRFETVARSDDLGLYYGTLWWQFEADGSVAPPKVTKENYGVKPGVSDTFQAALASFNRFYANPHTVLAEQTLEQISELYFGKSDKADAIFAANKALIGTRDAKLVAGWKLKIPGITP